MTTVLVTGATDGLGRVVARDLASRGLDVLVHGQSVPAMADDEPSEAVPSPEDPGEVPAP